MYRKNMQQKMEEDASYQFVKRVGHLPIMETAVSQLSNIYSKTKTSNRVFKYTLDATEYGVQTIVTTTKPIVDRFEKPIGCLDNFACKQLDKLESTYPIIKKPTEEIIEESIGLYEKSVSPTVERIINVKDYGVNKVNNIKDYSVNTVTGMKSYTVQKLDSAKTLGAEKINNVLETPYGQFVVKSVEEILDNTEKCVDYYLPADANEIKEKEETKEKEDTKEKEATDKNSINRTVQLSDKIRRRMYAKAMRDLHNVQKRSKETIDNMTFTVDLIQYAKNHVDGVTSGMEKAKDKLNSVWEEINKSEEGAAQENVSVDETNKSQLNQVTFERRLIATARHLTLHLKRSMSTVSETVSRVSNNVLPTAVQDYLTGARKHTDNLVDAFAKATNIQDLPSSALEQVRGSLSYMSQSVSVASEYVVNMSIADWLRSRLNGSEDDDGDSENSPENEVDDTECKETVDKQD